MKEVKCLLCQESAPTEVYYLSISQVELQAGRKITRWIDLKSRCCQRCSRKIIFLNRTMGIRVGLSILLMVGLFAGYVVLMPSLVAIGIPGGIVTFGTVAPSLAFITERRSWSGEDPCETFDVLGFTLGAGRQGNAT